MGRATDEQGGATRLITAKVVDGLVGRYARVAEDAAAAREQGWPRRLRPARCGWTPAVLSC